MSRPRPLHPVMFAAATLLFFHAYNLGRLSLEEDWLPLALLLLPAVALQFLVLRIRRARAAAVLLSMALVLFFGYGQVFEVLRDMEATSAVNHTLLMTVWIVLFVLGARATLRARSDLVNQTKILNLISAVMVVMPAITIASYPLRGGILWSWSHPPESIATADARAARPASSPDIYYIILDRYANEETLRASYGFDNREFLGFLRSKNFYVAGESRSNYMKTPTSLASSLNMEYLEHFTRDPGRESSDWIPAYSRLKDYRVWRFLKERGYTFVHMGTRWEPTRINPHADININVYTPPEAVWALAEQTILHPLGAYFGIGHFDFRRREWQRIPHQLDKLPEVSRDPQPTFTFLHLMIPHGPYVFNPDGSFVSEETMRRRPRRENYRNHLMYANRQVRQAIERLLAASPAPPVIVIQSDEGPIPIGYAREGVKFDWQQATTAELREKTGILNAYYLPGVSQAQLYPSITPVNSFRLIFNLYFDAGLPLLPDEQFAHSSDRHPYDFFPITDRLRADHEKRAER